MGRRLALVLVVLLGCRDERMEQGRALERRARWDDAIEVYEAAIRDYSYHYGAAHRIAQIECYRRGDLTRCREWTRRLEEWEPDSPLPGRLRQQIEILLAQSELRRGDLDAAEARVRKLVEKDDKLAAAYLLRGSVREARGQIPLALADYRRTIALRPRWKGVERRIEALRSRR